MKIAMRVIQKEGENNMKAACMVLRYIQFQSGFPLQ